MPSSEESSGAGEGGAEGGGEDGFRGFARESMMAGPTVEAESAARQSAAAALSFCLSVPSRASDTRTSMPPAAAIAVPSSVRARRDWSSCRSTSTLHKIP